MLQANQVVQIQQVNAETLLSMFENIIDKKLNAFFPPDTDLNKVEGYITETKAKDLLGGLSSPTMWKYRKNGIIQGYRIGRMVRYKESEILESLSKIKAKK